MRVVAAAVRVRIRAAAPRPIAERAACVARGASASWTGQWKRQHFHKVLDDDGSANGGARPDAVPIAACVSVRTAVCAIRATDRIRERATSIRAVIKGTARVARRARAWRTVFITSSETVGLTATSSAGLSSTDFLEAIMLDMGPPLRHRPEPTSHL